MSNELLAEYIKQGGNDKLIPLLWEKVKGVQVIKGIYTYNKTKAIIAKELNLSNERIRQIEHKALRDLRRNIVIKSLLTYMVIILTSNIIPG